MNGDLGEIVIGNFLFTGFVQVQSTFQPNTIVSFAVTKLDSSDFKIEDTEELTSIINKIDLWENLFSTVKLIYTELIGIGFDEEILENRYNTDKYEIKHKFSHQKDWIKFFINYSPL